MAKMGKLKWHGAKAEKIAREAGKRAVQICAADLQGKSSMRAPIDTGDLRANCSVTMDYSKQDEIAAKVGYDLPYAIIQHETSWFKHPKGGDWKYLENPFNENKGKYERFIKKTVKEALAKE